MKTIPVLATIRDAYRFTLTHLGAIIGLIWLPMIVLTVIGFFVLQRYYEALAGALASGSYATMGPQVLGLICYLIAGILLTTMMSIPVTQLALGVRKEGALVHFAFSTMEWRLFRGIMALLGFLLVPLFLVGVTAGVVEAGGGVLAGRAGQTLELLIVLFYMACVYFSLRFGVLLPALAACENGPMLPRAWALSRGNFWRMLVVMAAVVLPVMLLSAAIQFVALGRQGAMPGVSSSSAMAAAQFHQMALEMPLSSGINFLLAPVFLGLVVGAGAGMYRVLTSGGEIV